SVWALVDDNQKRFINELSDQSESSLLDFGTVNSLLFCWNNNSFKITFYFRVRAVLKSVFIEPVLGPTKL
ncbi:hypothetical protein, partial [Vibrio anguillarum]